MSASPSGRRRSSKTRSSTSVPALATQSKRKTKSVTLTRTKSKSRSRSRSRKRSKSPRSKRSSKRATVESVDTGDTLKRVTSRRYVYTVDEHDQGEPQVNEKLDLSGQSLTVITSAVFNSRSSFLFRKVSVFISGYLLISGRVFYDKIIPTHQQIYWRKLALSPVNLCGIKFNSNLHQFYQPSFSFIYTT